MVSARISSRLAKHEQKKVLKQTVLMGLGAIALGLGFIFFVLPNSVRVITFLTGGDEVLTQVNTIPLQPPLLSAPPVATRSAQIKIVGYSQPETEIVLVVNGSEFSRQMTDVEGTFTLPVELQEGENLVAAYAISSDKKESNLSQQYLILKDTQAPKIEVSNPKDKQTIELRQNQNLSVVGETDPGAQMFLNGQMVYTQANGAYSTNFLLQEGENKIELLARDQAGNESKKEVTVNFRL